MSRGQVSRSPSDLEMNSMDNGQGQLAQPSGNTDQMTQENQSNLQPKDEKQGHHVDETNKPHEEGNILTTSPDQNYGSRTSLKSEEGTAKKTPDYCLEHEHSDVTMLPDLSNRNQVADADSLASKEINLPEDQYSDNLENDSIEKSSSHRQDFRPESRFYKDDNEELVYEPGLPEVNQEKNHNYEAQTEDKESNLNEKAYYNTETGSLGHTSTTDDNHPLVFNKDQTAFIGSYGGPTIQPVRSLSSNQVMPVDEGTYEQAGTRQEHRQYLGNGRKNSIIIGENQSNLQPKDEKQGHHVDETNKPHEEGNILTTSPDQNYGSRTSLKSEEGTAKKTPDYCLEHEHSDVTTLPDLSNRNQVADADSLASKEINLPEDQYSDNLENDSIEKSSSHRQDFRPESRFYKDDNEELVYEPGLPEVNQEKNHNYEAQTEDKESNLNEKAYYNTETGSLGHTSTTDDNHPLVFNKDQTAFIGSYGGPTIQPVRSLSSNQVMPVDEGTYEQAGTRQEHRQYLGNGRKNSIIIGANENTDGPGCCGLLLYIFSLLLILISLPFSLVFTIKVVQEYERAVIFRLGRLPSGGAKGPGIFFIIPCIESYTKVDLRTVSFDVPPQEVLTKDSVTVSVDAVVYYKVSNPTVSVANVENAHHSTRLLAQTTLRNILGTKNMTEILSDRESISQGMQSTLDVATDRWGIKVERVEIKDVRLPVQLQRAMAAEAEATREARAKVIAAEGEQKAARSLKEASDIMSQSSAALQLRYLQTLNSISAEKNSTIIFPLPIDMLSSFMKK